MRAKGHVQKMKRQMTVWEKVCAIIYPTKGLVPKEYEKTSKLNRKKTNQEIGKSHGSHFTYEDNTHGKQSHEKMSNSIGLRKPLC